MANIPSENIQSRQVVPFLDMEHTSIKEKQTAKYGKKISESIYTYYTENRTPISSDDTWINDMRKMGNGKQGVDQYKKYVSNDYTSQKNTIDLTSEEQLDYDSLSADGNRYGWINAIWDEVNPIANIKTTTKGDIIKDDVDIKANVVDIDAMEEEDLRMMRHYAEAKAKPMVDFYRKKWGLPVIEETTMTTDYQRLLEIKRRGGFKPHYITGLQQIIRHTEDISEWDDMLKAKIYDDIFDLSIAFALATYCPTTYKVKWSYLDPKDVIVQYSNRHDFADSDYFAYFEYTTLNKIRAIQDRVSNGEKTGLSDEDWKKLAQKYTGYDNNPNPSEWNLKDGEVNYSGRLGSTKLCILHSYWIDYEVEKEVEYKTKYRKKTRAYKAGEKIREGDKLIQKRIQKVYRCSWIVGTDYVYDFGAMPNQPRKNLREAWLPFAGFNMREKSYTARLAPAANLFAIAWVRFCNAISKAQNDFYWIDMKSIMDIDDGNKKMPWQKVIRMMKEANILLGDSSQNFTGPLGGSGAPVVRIPGTLGDDIMKEMAIMEGAYGMIEKLTGLSPVSLGATPERDQAVGTTEMSLQSANRALKVIIGGVMLVKKKLGELTSSMCPTIIKEDEEAAKAYARVIGEDDISAIIESRRDFKEIGIELKARPSEALQRSLLEIAQYSLQKRDAGRAGLNETQVMWLRYHFETGGDFLEAFYKTQDWIEQDQKRIDMEKEAAQKAQTESNIASGKAAEEEKRKTAQLETQAAMELEKGKAITTRANNDADFLNELRKMKVEVLKEAGGGATQEINRMLNELSPSETNIEDSEALSATG